MFQYSEEEKWQLINALIKTQNVLIPYDEINMIISDSVDFIVL